MDRKWFKLYAQWSDSEWLETLEPGPRLCWPLIIEWVKCMGTAGTADMGSEGKIARHFQVPAEWISTLIEAAKNGDAISVADRRITIQKWAEYQGDSTSYERVKRHRQVQKDLKDDNADNALHPLRNADNAVKRVKRGEKEKEKEKEKEREKESVQTRESSRLNPPPVLAPNGSLLKSLNAPHLGPDEEANRQRELIRSQAAAARSIN